MLNRGRLLLAGLVVTLVLGFGVSAASANKLSFSSQRFRMTWSALQFIRADFELVLQECPVTLEGSFHSTTIRKVNSAQIGYVTRAELNSAACNREIFTTGATIGVETTPWRVTYESFTGTLPDITGLKLNIDDKDPERLFYMREQCLYRGLMGLTAAISAGAITRVDADPPRTLLVRASGNTTICPLQLRDRGSATFTVLGSTQAITVRLI